MTSSSDTKHKFSALGSPHQPDSLFRMALLEWEAAEHNRTTTPLSTNNSASTTKKTSGVFFPVDESRESKDLSLQEIINMTDDAFLLDEGGEDMQNINAVMSFPSQSSFLLPSFLQQQHQASLVTPWTSMATMTTQNDSMAPLPMMSSTLSFMKNSGFALSHQESVASASSTALSPKKRSRSGHQQDMDNCNDDDDDDDDDHQGPRFRPYQAGQWYDMFHELCAFKKRTGHCLVPHTFTENLPLARWVKRQRYQYKLLQEGKASSMTTERIQSLHQIGFVWDSQAAAWSERLAELASFGQAHGHTNVPSNYGPNPQLATWVKCQRRQYKLHRDGKASNMTMDRIELLENVGFEWELRGTSKKRQK